MDWEEAAERWAQAGLLSADQVGAIRVFEAARTAPAAAPPPPAGERFSATEALVYAGAATILAGIVYLVASSTPAGVQAAIALAAGAAGIVAARSLATGRAPEVLGSGRRAAGVAAAVAVSLVAAGATLAAIAGGFLVVRSDYFCEPPSLTPCYSSTDRGADALLGAAVALVLGSIAFELLRSGLVALLAAAAAYATAFLAMSRTDLSGPTAYTLASVVAGGWLLVLAARTQPWRSLLLFAALVVPMTMAFLTDSHDSLGLGGVLAGVAAVTALALAVPLDSNGLAIAGGLGIFGFCVDATVRSLGSTSPALVLIVGGLALVGCALLVQQAVHRNRRARATQA